MQGDITTERQRFSHQIGAPLAKGIVGAVNETGSSMPFGERTMARCWQDLAIDMVCIRIKDSPFAIIGGQRLPAFATRRGRPIPDGPSHHAPGGAFDCDPVPHDLVFCADLRPLFVNLDLRAGHGG